MIRFVARRLLGLVPVLLIILGVAFALMRAAPGGPFDQDKAVDPDVKAQLEAQYQLDKPLPVQFLAVISSYAAPLLEGCGTRGRAPSARAQDVHGMPPVSVLREPCRGGSCDARGGHSGSEDPPSKLGRRATIRCDVVE